jgi:hypothetical protein
MAAVKLTAEAGPATLDARHDEATTVFALGM